MFLFRQSKKTCGILWSIWAFFELPEKRRSNKYCLLEVNFFFHIQIISFMSESLNLLWKIAVQKAGCVFAYFCAGHKNNFQLQFCSSFNDIDTFFLVMDLKLSNISTLVSLWVVDALRFWVHWRLHTDVMTFVSTVVWFNITIM